jgi:hypothetical protein
MNRRSFIVSILALGTFIATSMLIPSVGNAQTDNVKASMAALIAKTGKLGAPKIEGTDPTGGRDWPALYFGTTKMNNSSEVVDEVVKEHGGVAALFVKAGTGKPDHPRYVRVATTVKKDDGSRDIGGSLDPGYAPFAYINSGKPYYGYAYIQADKGYDAGYEPIKDASGNVIGIYEVGYAK